MKIAILSDIHGNLEALTAAFAFLDANRVDTLYCLGDTIGYGANPNECCRLLRQRRAICVLGNHDAALWDDGIYEQFTPLAQRAMSWTRRAVDEEERRFLQSLPMIISADESTFVHASLDQPELFQYVFTEEEARYNLSLSRTPMCWIGHSHHPVIFSEAGEVETVDANGKYIVNVGSVGQPRDGDPRMSFGLFDSDRFVYENVRIPYDVEGARGKIIEAGLPHRLGDRLVTGV